MTQTELLKKLNYAGVIQESFYELREKAPEALDLMSELLTPHRNDSDDIQTICLSLISTIVQENGPVLDPSVTIHLVASALINGFLQGAIAAHKILETEELERMVKI